MMSKRNYEIEEQRLEKEVSKAYHNVLYMQQLKRQYEFLDSTYNRFAVAAQRRFDLGETAYLEKLTAESKKNEVALELDKANSNLQSAYTELSKWLQSDDPFVVRQEKWDKVTVVPPDTVNNAGVQYYYAAISSMNQMTKLQKNKLLPDLQLEFFRGSNDGLNSRHYNGFQVGLGIPILFGNQRSQIKAAGLAKDQVQKQTEDYKAQLSARLSMLMNELSKYNQALEVYDLSGRELSASLLSTADRSFQSGEIDFFQYIQSVDRAIMINVKYLENLQMYNSTALEINYLIN
jgi:cobalt-zinc-cadmium resistance protein CzcA